MNGVEAAASLFGPEEPASDPFAALGESQPSHEDLFPVTGASYFPYPSPTAQDSNNAETTATLPPSPQQELYPQNSSHIVGDCVPDLDAGSTSQQGWYSDSTYHIPEPALNEQASQYNDATSSMQDPYTQPSNFGTVANVSQSIHYTPAQSGQGYNPPSTYSNSTYSYSPSSQPSSSHYNPSYPASSQTSYTQQNIDSKPSVPLSVPPPAPAPVEAINRPKLPNAYDPPFPTTTKSKRSAVPRTGLGQTHSAYNSYQPHLPRTTIDGPFTALPSPQAPHLRTSAEQIGMQPPSEWRYLTHDASMSREDAGISAFDGPPADLGLVEGLHGQINNYNQAVDRHPQVAAPLEHGEPRVPDYTMPVPPTTNQVHDLYHSTPPDQPTKIRSRASSPLAHPSLSTAFRGSSPRNSLSPSSPLSGQQLAYVHSTPLIQAKIPTTESADSNNSPTEPLGELSSGQNNEQIMEPNETYPFDLASVNGFQDRQSASSDMYPAAEGASSSFPSSINGQYYDPYAPESYVNGERTSSPNSIRSWTGTSRKPHSAVNQNSPPQADILHKRSMSNGPTVSPASTSVKDPYAPSQHPRRQKSETDYGSYGYQRGRERTQNYPSAVAVDNLPVQEVLVKPFLTPYAPSPSLLGANDPLGRTAARIPVFSFGFGGKLVTCFHGAASLNTGFDVALSSRNSTGVHIRMLKQVIPESAVDTSTVAFPGPIFSDPASLTSLVRAGSTSQLKTKKVQVVKYLDGRIEEIALGLRYLNPDSMERRRAEGKLVLVKLLKVMVEHDGRLTGTPQLDTAVRVALFSHLEGPADASGTLATTFSTPADPVVDYSPSVPYSLLGGVPTLQEIPISVITLKPSSLDKIQGFLLRGERHEAYQYALDEKLWAHAMVIASSIDKEAWKEVVNDFLNNELRPKDLASGTDKATNGRECLRVAYSLFSGQGAAAVQELVPQTVLSRTSRSQLPVASQMTPRTPNFVGLPVTAPIPTESIARWAEAVAMMLSSPLSQETSAALTGLGDQLVANQLFEAAHVCYLLSPQTSPMGGLGNPSARIVLVGSQSPQNLPNFAKDADPLIFSEIVEFALSLTAPPRGQDPYQGIPHLQPYRFIRAIALAEVGELQLASRYCEAITAAVGRNSPYFTPTLLDHLKGLSDRITGVAHVDKSGSWMGAKLSKPSLDSIGGWLEGRFTKLVTGDTDTPTSGDEDVKTEDRSFAGPFSHYSTISSATPSAPSSPQPSLVNVLPPARTGSAMASYHPQTDRASSAMDYIKPKTSPAPRISSANPITTIFPYSTSYGYTFSNHGIPNGFNTGDDMITPRPAEHVDENAKQEANWWSSSAYDENSNTQTPTASTFLRVDGNVLPSSNGFVSLMDHDTYPPASPAHPAPEVPLALDDEEDLGFGNSRRDKPKDSMDEPERNNSSHTPQASEPTQPETNASKPAASGSWFSRWWRSDSNTPGPVKASLGEESAFYYDKELKRWVNKKAGNSESVAPPPPAPPSRAHTASPGMSGIRPLGTPSDTRPPPSRPSSAIDLSTSPPNKAVVRVRSNLVPLPESAPSTPTGSRSALPGPPPGRPKSQASKRNIRSRYVDVLQQETGA